jgi:hypothetical protein
LNRVLHTLPQTPPVALASITASEAQEPIVEGECFGASIPLVGGDHGVRARTHGRCIHGRQVWSRWLNDRAPEVPYGVGDEREGRTACVEGEQKKERVLASES